MTRGILFRSRLLRAGGTVLALVALGPASVPGPGSVRAVAAGRPVAAAGVAPQRAGGLRLVVDGNSLTNREMCAVLGAASLDVGLAPAARRRMEAYRAGALAALAGGQRVYGWNQALGPLKDRPLSPDEQQAFQQHVLRSHAAGVGPAFGDAVARLALVMKANAMARATMGVRPELVDRLLSLVNAGLAPQMPQIGPLGTGDLQPMAEAGLVAMGEDAPATLHGTPGRAPELLARAGLPPGFVFESGEALPLISGNSLLAAGYADAVRRAEALADLAEGAFALFMEATRAEASSLDPRTHEERKVPEEVEVAGRLRAMVASSGWMTETGRRRLGEDHPRVQDAVSVRAAPHIMGALRKTIGEAYTTLEREANASTSNPLIFPRSDGKGYEFVMGGNWDAALMGHAMDSLNAQIADLGVLSQELSARLLSPTWSYGLPANLAGGKVGLNSGMVQVQTVAVALVPEMQIRAVPAGILSRPAKFGQEDHNTMAQASLRNLDENLDRLETVLAVQLLMSAQGIDLIRPQMQGLPLGAGTDRLQAAIRRHIEPLGEDRYLSPDLDEMVSLVRGSELVGVVRRSTPPASGELRCAA
jgi:histidine ammonia-lyase